MAITTTLSPGVLALLLGLGSAASFPLGAILGMMYPLKKDILAILLSFGSGALLNALSIELFAAQYDHVQNSEYKDDALICICLFGVFGAVLFVVLNSYIGGSEDISDGQSIFSIRSNRTRIFDKPEDAWLLDQARQTEKQELDIEEQRLGESVIARMAGGSVGTRTQSRVKK